MGSKAKRITAQAAPNSGAKSRRAGRPKGSRPTGRQVQTLFRAGNPWAWRKGQSGNPGGRPRRLVDAYREIIAFVDADGIANADRIAKALLELALSGDVAAAHELRVGSEGTRLMIDLSRLSDDQLQRLARGEHMLSVLSATAGAVD